MTDDYLSQGIAAVKAGNTEEARKLLDAAIRSAPDDIRTWSWFYDVCLNNTERIKCLKQILRINPNLEQAKQRYNELMGMEVRPIAPIASQPEGTDKMKKCPYCAEEIQDDAIVCRFCGRELNPHKLVFPQKSEPQKKNKHTLLYILLTVVFLLIMICIISGIVARISGIGGGGGGGTGGVPTVATIVYAKDLVRLVSGSLSCSTEYGIMTITGKIQNLSNVYDLQFVEIRGTVERGDGTVVNTNISFIDSDILYKNSTSTFSVMVNDPNDEGTQCNMQIEDARFK